MQLYDALFHLAWMLFMIPFLGWIGMKEDSRRDNQTIENFSVFVDSTIKPSHSLNVWNEYSGKMWRIFFFFFPSVCFPPTSFFSYNFADNKLLLLFSKHSPLINNLHILVKQHSYYPIIRFYLSEVKKKSIFADTSHLTCWAPFHIFSYLVGRISIKMYFFSYSK